MKAGNIIFISKFKINVNLFKPTFKKKVLNMNNKSSTYSNVRLAQFTFSAPIYTHLQSIDRVFFLF